MGRAEEGECGRRGAVAQKSWSTSRQAREGKLEALGKGSSKQKDRRDLKNKSAAAEERPKISACVEMPPGREHGGRVST